jgi:hypothetical protein
MGERSGKAMRVVIFIITMLLFLYACSQPPEMPEEDENDIYRCYLNKDGTKLICPEKIKPTKVASD